MKLLDALKIAFKNLWRRKLRTVLTVFAVSVGVVAVVTLVSIALGAQNAFIQQFESIGMLRRISVVGNSVSEMSMMSGGIEEETDDAVPLTDELIEKIKQEPHVTGVYADIEVWAYEYAIINHNGTEKKLKSHLKSAYATVDEQDQITLAQGRFFTSNNEENVVILGNSYIKQLELEPADIIGQNITLKSYKGFYGYYDELPDPENNDEDIWRNHQSEITAKVVGVTPAGPSEYAIYVPVEWAKKLMMRKEYKWPDEEDYEKWQKNMDQGLAALEDEPKPTEELQNEINDNGYQQLGVYIDESDMVEEVANNLEEKYSVGTITMEDILTDINKVFRIIEIVLGIIGSISLGVAAIGIINTMIMSIYERTREIGVMKAVGASRAAIRRLFTIEASLVGFLGGVIGLAVGYGLTLIINEVANHFMSQDSIPLTDIVELPLYLTLGVLAFSTIIGTLAGLYPAWRASRLDPIEALHNE